MVTHELVPRVLDALRARGLTLGVAESATGGLLGARLTAVPGASDVFHGGFITYVDRAKAELLGVDAALLAEKGAVCAEVAQAMASRCRERLGVDHALAITGFAGPGAPGHQPVGTVFIGHADAQGASAFGHVFQGMREDVRDAFVAEALRVLLAALGEKV